MAKGALTDLGWTLRGVPLADAQEAHRLRASRARHTWKAVTFLTVTAYVRVCKKCGTIESNVVKAICHGKPKASR